jgi:hypothetical protein
VLQTPSDTDDARERFWMTAHALWTVGSSPSTALNQRLLALSARCDVYDRSTLDGAGVTLSPRAARDADILGLREM